MSRYIVLAVVLILVGGGLGWFYHQKEQNPESHLSDQLVFVGDSQSRVYDVLGDPNIEFPRGATLVQWYEGYEITLSNGTVVAVDMTPVETDEEKQAREQSIKEDEERLRTAYQAVVQKEKISYDAWLDREEARLAAERRELAKVEAYEQRRSEEKKAAIRAEAIRRSRHHYWY